MARIHSGSRHYVYAIRADNAYGTGVDTLIYGGAGAPSGGTLPNGQVMDSSQSALYLRDDGTATTLLYGTVDGGSNWTAFAPGSLSSYDLNGTEFVLDADGDTSITADTDDQIDVKIAGADDFQLTANTFSVLTGSSLNLADSCKVQFGTGQDITMAWDGSDFDILQATANSSIKLGVSGAGIDMVWYGDTATYDMTWDQSADTLLFNDNAKITLGTGSDAVLRWDGTDLDLLAAADDQVFKIGNGTNSWDVWLYGNTANDNIIFDASGNELAFDGVDISLEDADLLKFGDADDISLNWDGSNLVIATVAADTGAVEFGSSGAGVDLVLYGDTATYDVTWDQSADSLIFNDNAKLVIGTGGDDTISHDGTDTLWAHTTGDLVIDNQDANDPTVLRLGTDTNATSVQVQNNSGTAVHTINAMGNVIVAPTTVDMANAEHTMTLTGAGANQTDIAGPVWFVDPNGGSVTLVLPAEASCTGFMAMVVNTADAAETVTIQDDAKGYTVIAIDQNQAGWIACDGTTWYGFMGAET